MCGIAGVWSFRGGNGDELCARAGAMAGTLRHRGPDDDGVWCDAAAGVALGFRRLSIIDLSAAGAQPMHSSSGRYVIVFNGEIYNYRRLREELGPRDLRGHSDTEILLECMEAWGLDRAVRRFIGMFAFAVWDHRERTLSLVRDRAGVKPLYYALSGDEVAFASELKALPRAPIDRAALSLYTRFGYVPAPYSIFEGIRKLMPGHILTIDANGTADIRAYWDSARVAEQAASQPFRGGEDDAAAAVESLLADAVRLRLISDVPLGLFLSAGIDSPLIAALMQREAGPISTFTIGFDESFSEAPQAAAVARYLGTRHTEAIIRGKDALDAIPLMASIYDEPLGDSSSIPTYLVSKMARQHVTVALSGDGGDELFGGYHRYFLGERLDAKVARVPRALRPSAGVMLQTAARLPVRRHLRNRLRRLGEALVLGDPISRFENEVGPRTLDVVGAPDVIAPFMDRARRPALRMPTELMMYLDAISYLPDDILTKVDRASMAVSLEVREPLLDHRLIELAWSLPLSMKTRDGRGKWILRKVLARHLPEELIGVTKSGFGLPIDEWLRGPLRDWAASLLDPKRITSEGWFDAAGVRKLWNGGPVAGNEGVLWRLLMFQQWLPRSH